MRLPCKHHQVKVKVNIYSKMLNTIDFFNNATLAVDTSMLGDGVTQLSIKLMVILGCIPSSVMDKLIREATPPILSYKIG